MPERLSFAGHLVVFTVSAARLSPRGPLVEFRVVSPVPYVSSLDPLMVAATALAGVVAVIAVAVWIVRRREADGDVAGPQILMPAPDPERDRLMGGFGSRRRGTRLLALIVIVGAVAGGVYLYTSPVTLRPAEAPLPRYELNPTAVPGGSASGSTDPARGSLEDAGDGILVPATGERLIAWSGDAQTGRSGRLLPRSLGVVVLDPEGRPAEGREIRFEVAEGGGELRTPVAETSRAGLAQTAWRLGPAQDSQRVRAYLPEHPESTVIFTATLEAASRAPGLALDDGREPVEDIVVNGGGGEAEPEGDGEGAEPAGSPDRSEPDDADRDEPVPVPSSEPATWSAGGVNTCRLGGAGGVECWGAGVPGERSVESLLESVAAGVLGLCGVAEDGAIACWASRAGGSTPVEGRYRLPSGRTPAELVLGSEHACVRAASGTVYCWGSNARGQLGTGGGDAAQPSRVPGLEGVVQLAGGWYHTCALTGAGTLYCWGANGSGQLGVGSRDDVRRPTLVPTGDAVRQVTAGSAHTCAVGAGGEPWCWGENRYGQLGRAEEGVSAEPGRVDTDLRFSSMAAGGVHTCGLTEAGRAWCWGRNVFGQLGDGSTRDSPVPMPVVGETRFVRLSGGGAHTCGESGSGDLYCWGNNIQGQLGDGTRENRVSPVRSNGP